MAMDGDFDSNISLSVSGLGTKSDKSGELEQAEQEPELRVGLQSERDIGSFGRTKDRPVHELSAAEMREFLAPLQRLDQAARELEGALKVVRGQESQHPDELQEQFRTWSGPFESAQLEKLRVVAAQSLKEMGAAVSVSAPVYIDGKLHVTKVSFPPNPNSLFVFGFHAFTMPEFDDPLANATLAQLPSAERAARAISLSEISFRMKLAGLDIKPPESATGA